MIYKPFILREEFYKIIHKSKRLEMPVEEVGGGGGNLGVSNDS